MNYLLAALMGSVFILSISFADGGEHTPDFCSATDKKVCAHIGHMSGMKTKGEAEFMVDILLPKEVSHLKVDLWMPEHNHGTEPVTVSPYKTNKFKIKKALFTMPGIWHARLSFDQGKTAHKIEIPLTIKD